MVGEGYADSGTGVVGYPWCAFGWTYHPTRCEVQGIILAESFQRGSAGTCGFCEAHFTSGNPHLRGHDHSFS